MNPVTVFIERFRAAVSVLILLSCSSRIVFVHMCILMYYWANKMTMPMMMTPVMGEGEGAESPNPVT